MINRIKNIFGNKIINNIDDEILIEQTDCITIFYENKNIVLAVYGYIFGSIPHKTINIKLTNFSKDFSGVEEIKDYIKNGCIDKNISRQKEIINICLFGNEIKKKINELEVSFNQGKSNIEIRCSDDCAVAIKNYAERKHSCDVTRTNSKIIIKKK